jgi:hypothetical protein
MSRLKSTGPDAEAFESPDAVNAASAAANIPSMNLRFN